MPALYRKDLRAPVVWALGRLTQPGVDGSDRRSLGVRCRGRSGTPGGTDCTLPHPALSAAMNTSTPAQAPVPGSRIAFQFSGVAHAAAPPPRRLIMPSLRRAMKNVSARQPDPRTAVGRSDGPSRRIAVDEQRLAHSGPRPGRAGRGHHRQHHLAARRHFPTGTQQDGACPLNRTPPTRARAAADSHRSA